MEVVVQFSSCFQRVNMSQAVCRFNKFGYCKYGKYCFRKHENRICENAQCNVQECPLRHPRKCVYFLKYKYCKFGLYCKFSHDKIVDTETLKQIKDLEDKLKSLKKEINDKEVLIKEKDEDIKALKEIYEFEMKKQESESLKEIEDIRNDRNMIQMFFDDFKEDMAYKYGYDSSAETTDEEIDYMKIISVGNFDCNLCDFKGKTTGGLKTHKKRKHKDK